MYNEVLLLYVIIFVLADQNYLEVSFGKRVKTLY